tara:strand:- start:2602 stop:3216 length:615 start_codon:yes stop_codon:yes gene_type:complete
MNKQTYTKLVTPVGVSQFAWLNKPDTKFDDNGHYKVNLILDGNSAKPLIKSINDENKKAVEMAKEKSKGKNIKTANTPFEEEYADGKPTGNIIFKFKAKAKIIMKNGDVIDNKVPIFDSKGTPMTNQVWSGSEMKVSADMIPYYTAMAGAGVSLRLKAVQITKLVEGSGANSSAHGFSEVKDGYVAPEDKTFENEVEQSQNADF